MEKKLRDVKLNLDSILVLYYMVYTSLVEQGETLLLSRLEETMKDILKTNGEKPEKLVLWTNATLKEKFLNPSNTTRLSVDKKDILLLAKEIVIILSLK